MIGQVANCPKCNSLVMIAAPRQIRVENSQGESVDSMAMTKDGLTADFQPVPGVSETGSEVTTSPESSVEGDDYRLSPVEDEPGVQGEYAQRGAMEPGLAGSAVNSWETMQPVDETPLLPSDEWTSEGSTKLRQYLLVGFLGLSGVVLAILGFFMFLQWYGRPGADENGEAQLAAAETTADPMQAASPVNDLDVEEVSEAASTAEFQDASSSETEMAMAPSDNEAIAAEPAQEDVVSTAGVDSDDSPVETTSLPAELPDSLLAEDANPDAAESEPIDPKQQVRDALPNAWLQQFAPMLEWEVVPTLPDTGMPLEPPPITAEDLGLANSGGLEPLTDVDWSERATVVLPGLILSGNQRLAQIINLWTHLSGVPTIVNLDSLRAADRDPNQVWKLEKIQSASIREIVQRIAASSQVELEVRENRFLELRASSESISGKLPSSIPVDDVLPGEAGTAWLQTALESLYPQNASAWTIDQGKLSADLSRMDLGTWFEIVRMLENLRAAQGLPSQLSDFSAASLAQPWVSPDSMNALDTAIQQLSPQPRPVGQVLSSVCSEVGLDCWMDWPHLGRNGLGPGTTAVAVTYGRTLRQVLNDYAERYSLVVAIEGPTSLWITTPQAYRSQPRVYVIPSGGRTAEQLQMQLREYTPLNANGVGELIAIPTPDAAFVVVRCCRPRVAL